jgi:hypothetical protein
VRDRDELVEQSTIAGFGYSISDSTSFDGIHLTSGKLMTHLIEAIPTAPPSTVSI